MTNTKKTTVAKTTAKNVRKPAAKKVKPVAKNWAQAAKANQIVSGLVIKHLRDEGQKVVTHKDQPAAVKLINKDLYLPGDNGKLVKYGQMDNVIVTISTWPELANTLEVFCSDMYFPIHRIRKIGTKFVYDHNIAFPSKRDTVLIDVDQILGKAKPAKADKPVVTVEAKKVVTVHELIDAATHAAPAKKLVSVPEVRKLAKEYGLKLEVTDDKFFFSNKTGAVVEIALSVDNNARRMSVQTFRQKNAKVSDGRWVNFKHSLGTTLRFKSMLELFEKQDAPHRQQIAYIKQYMTDDVCEAAQDAIEAYMAHQEKIAK